MLQELSRDAMAVTLEGKRKTVKIQLKEMNERGALERSQRHS